MPAPASLSIRARLLMLVFAAMALAELVSLAFGIWQEAVRYGEAKRGVLFSTAQVIAAAAARATAENNVTGAYQVVRAMGRIDGLVYAEIERADGHVMADVGTTEQLASDLVLEGPNTPISPMRLLRTRTIEVKVPVVFEGSTVGTARFIADTADLPGRIMSALALTLAGGGAALVLALVIVLRMQGGITRPLITLTQAMSRVRANHDYATELQAERRDEVGILVEGFNGMMADIRERDQRLARHRARLEQDVAERTLDYQRAADEASAANKAKSDFLATMSHEIRTPMNGILVMAELLAAAEMPPPARRQAEVIARSGASLLAIINDILDVSKIEAGKLEVEKLDVDPFEAVDTVLRLFADRAATKGLDLAANITLDRAALLCADPTRLGQVLANLVNNALKFTARGGVSVDVTPLAGGRVQFSVVDTGIGIAPDKLAQVFEAFSQADQSTTREFGGTGLGLTIARRLVSAMGGVLEVTSTLGQGTTFFFSLPLSAQHRPIESAASVPQQDAPPRRALVSLPGVQSAQAILTAFRAAGFVAESASEEELPHRAVGADLVVTSPDRLLARPRLGVGSGGGILVLTRPQDDVRALEASRRLDATLGWPFAPAELDDLIARHTAGLPLQEPRGPGASQADSAPTFAGLRVLVADDSEVNREVADAALQRLGITAEFVVNGRQALDAALAQRFDLVLMDGSMPELDGFAATRALREQEQALARPATPVVALTAHVVGTAAEAWREAGMDGVLHKPFTLAQMAEVIRRHARTHGSGGIAPPPQPGAPPAQRDDTALDRTALDDLLDMAGGAMPVVQKITGLYRVQSRDKLVEVLEAARTQNLEALASAAHALKSMSFNVGARQVAACAGEIEHLARIEAQQVEGQTLARLEEEHGRALLALDAWLAAA